MRRFTEESRKLIPPGWEISSLNEEYPEDITIYDEEGNIVEKYRRMIMEPQHVVQDINRAKISLLPNAG